MLEAQLIFVEWIFKISKMDVVVNYKNISLL